MSILKVKNPEAAALTLQQEIRRSEEARYDHRLHGVLLVAQGMSPPKAAELLSDAPRTLELWVHHFEEEGLQGLHESQRSGRPSKINPKLLAKVQRALQVTPTQVGLSADLWDANALSAYLHSLGVNLKPRQCHNLLQKWKLR